PVPALRPRSRHPAIRRTSRSFGGFRKSDLGDRPEFMQVMPLGAFCPGIALAECLAEGKALEQGLALGGILADMSLDRWDADTLRPFIDAYQIASLVAIELDQRHNDFDRFILGVDMGEDFRTLDVETGGAGKVNLVARIDTDDADILTGCLGAIARTARDRHLHLGGRP